MVTLKGPCTNPACGPCHSGCGPLSISAGACESLEGSGNLRGWSNFNASVTDWNLIKFTAVDYSMSSSPMIYDLLYPSQNCVGSPVMKDMRELLSASATWDVSTNARVGDVTYQGDTCNAPPHSTNSHPSYPFSGLSFGSGFETLTASIVSDLRHQTEYDYTPLTCRNFGPNQNPPFCGQTIGSALFVRPNYSWSDLGIPDTVAAALARGSPTSGSNCRTSPGTIGSTSAGSSTQIAVSGTRSVKVPLTLAGVTPGSYTFIVDLDIYNTSDVFQSSEEVEITVELEESDITACEAEYEYHVPIRTGEKVEFAGVRDLEAA